nr:MAG TPA: Protein of unknown function (DUF5131) [Caudoviricetes sp.]
MGNKTKIDWCDATWNPVTGCKHGCEYCYARRIAERFGGASETHNNECCHECQWITEGTGEIHDLDEPIYDFDKGRNAPYPFDFDPTFHRYKLDEPQHWKKPRTIFVCSMADLFGDWAPDEWIAEVFKACDAAPWHRYIFLTKNPKRLCRMAIATKVFLWNVDHPDSQVHPKTEEYVEVMRLPIRDNWWFGSSLDNADARRFDGGFNWNTFTSIEPLMEHMQMGIGSFGSDRWTIIGAETGKRKNKVVPKRAWIDNILEAAAFTGVKVFMKESLRELMGADFRQEFPWEVTK